ncbi:hypothetical protein EJB05_41529, partial [Eragrostis curvula]
PAPPPPDSIASSPRHSPVLIAASFRPSCSTPPSPPSCRPACWSSVQLLRCYCWPWLAAAFAGGVCDVIWLCARSRGEEENPVLRPV